MDIKDSVVRLYIQKFIINKSQNIETPGFVFFKVSGKTPIFTRQVILPEAFFVNLEKKMKDRGEKATAKLYSAGKKFGFRFALLGGFSKKGEKEGKALIDYINIINKFIEGTYASRIDCNVDLEKSVCEYDIDNFIVINKLGYGSFLPLGAAAGMLSFILNNSSIEGVIVEKEAGKQTNRLVYAPKEYLSKKFQNFISETNLDGLSPDQNYISFNSVKRLKNSQYSFQNLLESNLFTFNKGIIMHNNQRYFIVEVGAIYLVEKELKGFEKEIYQSAFEVGKQMISSKNKGNGLKTVIDLLAAFGWGDATIIKKGDKFVVNLDYFPYSKFYSEISFGIVRGIVEGLISSSTGEEIKFGKVEKMVSQGYLSISLT